MSEEQVNVTMNQFESSGSSSNILMKNVEIGPQSVELNVLSASSATQSSISWKINTSDNLLLSRRMIIELPISYVIDGGAGTNLRNYFISPRADCLNRIITSCQVNCNGSSIVSNPSDFCEVVQFYGRETQHFNNQGLLSQTPSVPDLMFSQDLIYDGTEGQYPDNLDNDLRNYHLRDENFSLGYPSRLASTPYFKLNSGAVNDTGNRSSGITFFVRCALKNPLFSNIASEVLCNISTLEITLNFDTSRFRERLFFGAKPIIHQAAAEVPYANITAGLGVVTTNLAGLATIGTIERNDCRLNYYTINPSDVNSIPETLMLPSTEIFRNQYQLGVRTGPTEHFNVTHPEISLSQIPSMIFISCIPQYSGTSKNMFSSDYHCPIRNLTIQVNGQSLPYTMYSGRDLYDICCQNGLKQTFQSFNTWTDSNSGIRVSSTNLTGSLRSTVGKKLGVGSPICLVLSKDVGTKLKVNLNEQFRLQVRYDASNTSTIAGFDFVSNVHYVMNNTLILQKGSPLRQINGISHDEYANALSQGFVQTIGADFNNEQDDLLGGSFTNTFKQGGRSLIRFMNAANSILQSAQQIFPDKIPQQITFEANRVNQLGNVIGNSDLLKGSGMLGGQMMGGSRLDMMRAQGLLR